MPEYKKFPITTFALRRPGVLRIFGKSWRCSAIIFDRRGNASKEMKRFEPVDVSFRTKEAAKEHVLNLCKAWIDEQSSGQAGLNAENSFRQLQNAVNFVAREDRVLWAVFATFWASNAVLLVPLFREGKNVGSVVGPIVCAVGLIISLCWFVAQRRAWRHLQFFNEVVKELENHLRELGIGFQPRHALSTEINDATAKKHFLDRSVWVRKLVIPYFPIIPTILWFGGLLCFALPLLCSAQPKDATQTRTPTAITTDPPTMPPPSTPREK